MKQALVLLREDRLPDEARRNLVVRSRKLLVLGEFINVTAERKVNTRLLEIGLQLHSIGEDRHERVVRLRALVEPAVNAHHDLDHRVAFLGPAEKQTARDLGKADFDTRLAEVPVLVRSVVHVAERP